MITRIKSLLFDHVRWSDIVGLSAVLLMYGLLIIVIHPFGDFPFNDDWSYSMALESWMDREGLQIPDFSSPMLLGQLIWTLPWLALSQGFSFGLVAGTVTLLVICSIPFLIGMFHRRGIPTSSIAFLIMFVIMNPVFLLLSFTYMTDVPFTMVCMLAFLAFIQWSERQNSVYRFGLFLGMSSWAFLIRQPGLLLFGLPILLLVDRGKGQKGGVAILSLIWGLLLFGAAHWVLRMCDISNGVEFRTLANTYEADAFRQWMQFARQGIGHAGYLGFFFIPLSVVLVQKWPWKRILFVAILAIGFTGILYWLGESFPYKPNMLRNGGVGPETLRDTYLLGMANTPQWSPWVGSILHTLALISLGAMLNACLWLWQSQERKKWARPTMVFSIAYWLVCSSVSMFDRYMLPLVPILGVLFFLHGIQRPRLFAWIVLLGISLAAVLSCKECFAWHHALATSVRTVQHMGADLTEVDFGYEWMGRLKYRDIRREKRSTVDWWVDDPRVVVTFGPIPGYREIGSVPFYRSLWFRPDQIWILERIEDSNVTKSE